MDYRRLIGILILGIFIVYINQTIREGLDMDPNSPCPDGKVRIGGGPQRPCGVPGSTFRPKYRGSETPTCEPGYTYLGGAGECSKLEGGVPVQGGKIICPAGAFAVEGAPGCYEQCPAGTIEDGILCSPSAASTTTTTTPPPPTDKSVLSDLPAPSMSCSVENFAPSE